MVSMASSISQQTQSHQSDSTFQLALASSSNNFTAIRDGTKVTIVKPTIQQQQLQQNLNKIQGIVLQIQLNYHKPNFKPNFRGNQLKRMQAILIRWQRAPFHGKFNWLKRHHPPSYCKAKSWVMLPILISIWICMLGGRWRVYIGGNTAKMHAKPMWTRLLSEQ